MSSRRHHRASSHAPQPISWAPSEGSNAPPWLAPPQNPIPRPSSAQSWNALPNQLPLGEAPATFMQLHTHPSSSMFSLKPLPNHPFAEYLYAPAPVHDIRRPSSTGPYPGTHYSGFQQTIPSYAQPDTFDERNLARRPKDWRDDYEPHYGAGSLSFPNLQRQFNDLDLAQLATQPPAHFLRLMHSSLPWYIDAFNQLATGIQSRHYYNEVMSNEDREAIGHAFQERTRADPGLARQGVCRWIIWEIKLFLKA
ncbi:hypothetical protein BDQ17DRAFT_1331459 [Cyathus striatus]|nr:hypothetical protein BDQ17DRAFT_1331459 [Cyathus striatus]